MKPVPLLPVPVVRLIIPDNQGRVLLLRRARTSYGEGAWCLPGGKIDYGSTVEETVRKELREETGLECESFRFLFYQDSLPPTTGSMHCLNLYFECRVTGDCVLNPESAEFRWIESNEAEGYNIAFRNREGLQEYWRTT